MSIRTPQRPGGGMFGPRPVAVYKPRGRFAGILFGAFYRFLAGQVVLRRPGKWDARYTTWAPAVPDHVAQGREDTPRSTWARRPGYQRQLARLAAIAAVIGYFRAPALTLAILAVLALVAIARAVVMAHRRHVYGPVIASWWDYVASKTGASGDPLHWVRFTSWEIRWEPVTPLAAATRLKPPDVDPDQGAPPPGDAARSNRRSRDRGGWLTRWVSPLARVLRPLASPIGEQAWVINARARFADDRRLWVAIAARTVELLVRLAEQSRTIRVRPHLVKHALTSDNARIEIHYPATYPAHPQDIAEIQRVLRDRLPARAPDLDAPADDDPEDQDEDTEAALPVGAWTARNDHKHLMIVFERTKLMPSDVPMTRADFEGLPFHNIPIGVEVTRRGRLRPVLIPLKAKTPMVSVAASTGWGKTTIANVLSAHLLYHGAFGVLLDPKMIGYVDAYRGVSPYIEIRTTVDGWRDAILRVRDEMNRRYWLMEQCAERVKSLGLPKMTEYAELYFQPLFVLEDEKGSLTTAIANWFKREGGPEKDGKPTPGKGTPPTFDQQQEILWRGRASAIHVFTFAQQNNARVFLNTDMRDQYMFRILAGPQTRQSWDMTYPGTKKRAIPKKKGRAVYAVGPEGVRDVQLGRISDDEARECAIHGIGVADRENQVRAELLALATGRPEWEVSPLPFWVTPPGQTAVPVPGHGSEGDSSLASIPPPLSVVKNAPASVSAADPEDVDDDDLNAFNEGDFTSTRDDEESPDLVVGEAAAAEYLGITLAAFAKRRKRAKNNECPPINGEIRVGRSPAWPPLELTEWNNLFRSAG